MLHRPAAPNVAAPAAIVVALAVTIAVPRAAPALEPGPRALDSAPLLVLGDLPGDEFGVAVISPGDLDGDSLPDLVVSAPGAMQDAGRVYVIPGAALSGAAFVSAGASALATLEGEPGSRLGETLAAPGDFDGDGWPDFAVGAPAHPGGDAPPGRVLVVRGGPGALAALASSREAAFVLDGPHGNAAIGELLAPAGDADGDGLQDLAVLARDADTQSGEGRVAVFRGRAAGAGAGSEAATIAFESGAAWTWLVSGLGAPADGIELGGGLASAGDRDGDGFGELWLGLPGASEQAQEGGALLLLPGRAGADAAELDAFEFALSAMHGAIPGERLGAPISVAWAAGDGMLWVGSAGPERGASLAWPLLPEFPWVSGDASAAIRAPAGVLGGVLAAAADLDGDTLATPVAAHDSVEADGVGGGGAGLLSVYVSEISGESDMESADARFAGLGGAAAGRALAVANLDGDAYDDVLVGAPGAHSAGAVYVLLGSGLADGDGVAPAMGDCDDTRGTVSPLLAEVCDDGLDNDCNGHVDGVDAPCATVGSGLVADCSLGGSGDGSRSLPLAALLGFARLSRRARRRLRPWLPGGLALLLLPALPTLPACQASPPAELPSIRIVSPDGEVPVVGFALPVQVAVENGRLAPQLDGLESAADQFLWRLTLDGVERGVGGGPLQVVDAVMPGLHIADVELVRTLDHAALDPRVTATVSFEMVSASPSVVILDPGSGATVPPDGFVVRYRAEGFTLDGDAVGQANQVGVGHVAVRVGGVHVGDDADGQLTVSGIEPGETDLAVELVNNDGSSLDPPVAQSIPITVAQPVVTITGPDAGELVTGPGVTLQYEVSGFQLDPDGVGSAAEPGVGHTHVYLDGIYSGLDATGSLTVPSVNGCTHEFLVVLALDNHAEQAASDSVLFEYQPCIAIESPADGIEIGGAQVTLSYFVRGFEIDPEAPDGVPQGGHLHVYVDGERYGFTTDPTAFTVDGLEIGEHEIELRAADPGHDEGAGAPDAEPLVSARVSVTLSGR